MNIYIYSITIKEYMRDYLVLVKFIVDETRYNLIIL